MTIELDHTIVPSRSQVKSAKLLAELLGVAWAEKSTGLFSPVYWEMLTVSYARQES